LQAHESTSEGGLMGLDDMLKDQIRARAPELKKRLVDEYGELTHKDMESAGDDPDEIVDQIHKKTGQPREQIEQRVRQHAQSLS
jgi:hypothetical protein